MKKSIFIILLFISVNLFSQKAKEKVTFNQNIKRVGLTAGIGGMGAPLISSSVDVYITKNLNIEGGIGNGFFGKGTVIYTSISHHLFTSEYYPSWNLFYGIGYAYFEEITAWTSYGKDEKNNDVYLVSGIQYISKNGFTFKLEGGPGYSNSEEISGYNNSKTNTSEFTWYAGLKIGVHFGGDSHDGHSKEYRKHYRKSSYELENYIE